ncbi:hypothetical protein RchiOBHm_Chr4g0419791 [Rosa chinensis]|uniref:Uncharacterized protein n=1 Tax=Rosa chinensis TaxID=74649 RepID=A0A2P6QXS6_ROSCH|nr:hypothetical protein RchiOBHm_Chr4g0419791 [Rosa chinensis]
MALLRLLHEWDEHARGVLEPWDSPSSGLSFFLRGFQARALPPPQLD